MQRFRFFISLLLIILFAAGCAPTPTNQAGAVSSPSPAGQPSASSQASATSGGSAVGKVASVAAGSGFSLIVAQDGRLLACGEYEKNMLGNEEYVPDIQKLRAIDTDVQSCAVGPGLCAEVKKDGGLYIWGINKTFFPAAQKTPQKILDGVQSVSLGDSFLLAIKTDGSLWAMGLNTYGQLGTGNTQDAQSPVEVMRDVKKACAATGFSLILKTDGTLLCCGLNFYKQFGGVSNTQVPFIEFGKDSGAKMDVQSQPAELKKGVSDIAAGSSHIMVLDTNGDVWCMGNNASGQIGDNYGENTEVAYFTMNIYQKCGKFTKVLDGADKLYAGDSESFAVKKDGSVWAWGENNSGQLGDGSFCTAYVPVKVAAEGFDYISPGDSHTLAIGKDGTLWAWGDNAAGQLCAGTATYSYKYRQVADRVAEVASSGKTTLILKDDGTLLGCGYNNWGQLADGTILSSSAPKEIMKDVLHIAAGPAACYCVKKDGTLWAWGNNDWGDMGNGHQENIDHAFQYDFYRKIDNDHIVPAGYKKYLVDPVQNYAPAQILSGIAQVSAEGRAGLAIAADGTLYAWGQSAAAFRFGNNSGSNGCIAAPVKINADVKSILNQKMLSKTNGEVWDWDENPLTEEYETKAYKDPISDVVSAADGYNWRMAVKSDGTLWIWGITGIINKKTISEPLQIEDHVRAVSGGTGGNVTLVKDDNSMYDILSIDIDDLMTAYSPGKKLTEGQYVKKAMDNVQYVVTADTQDGGLQSKSTFIIKTDGTLWVSGSNKYGQLGDGSVSFTPTQIP